MVGGDHQYPPFEYLNARGAPVGYCVELTRAIAAEMGLDEQVHFADSQEAVLRAVAEGSSDCAVVVRISSLHTIRANGWTNLDLGKKPFLTLDYCYATRNDRPAILAQFSEGLKALEQNGEYRRIYNKWLGVYAEDPPTLLRALRAVHQLIAHETDSRTLLRETCNVLTDQRGYVSAWVGLRDGDQAIAVAESGVGDAFEAIRAGLARNAWPPCCREAMEGAGVAFVRNPADACAPCPLRLTHSDTAALAGALRSGGTEYGVLVVALPASVADDPEEQSLFGELCEDIGHALYGIESEQERVAAERAREQLQAQLLQAQRMESVGRLAGGIAQDFNNILQMMMGYGAMLDDALPPDSELREYSREIAEGVDRAAALTRQLLAFARKQTISPKVLDLNEAVESMLKMLRRLIGEDIDLVWQPEARLWAVRMDPGQIDQILANLCVNARDAIGGVGRVTIETGNATCDEDDLADHPDFAVGVYVLLAVSDDGCGMDRETRDNIFEPFFTTKGVGEGTGLGLATVYGIVKQNDGFIHVYSEPGKGANFRIYLPHDAAETANPPPATPSRIQHGRGETILFLEDDPAILNLGRRMLTSLGYDVHAASTPADALALLEKHNGNFHLLITDVVMPAMNGRELAEQARLLCPAIKTLFISGYTANVIAHRGILDEGTHFIPKPFSIAQLAAKVHDVLNAPA